MAKRLATNRLEITATNPDADWGRRIRRNVSAPCECFDHQRGAFTHQDLQPAAAIGYARPMHIAIVGAGYVGLVTAACLAHLGTTSCAWTSTPAAWRGCARATCPIHEPGLDELVAEGLARRAG